MGILVVGAVIGGGLFIIWAICRTPAGEKTRAEAAKASQTAQKAQLEAIFGEQTEE